MFSVACRAPGLRMRRGRRLPRGRGVSLYVHALLRASMRTSMIQGCMDWTYADCFACFGSIVLTNECYDVRPRLGSGPLRERASSKSEASWGLECSAVVSIVYILLQGFKLLCQARAVQFQGCGGCGGCGWSSLPVVFASLIISI